MCASKAPVGYSKNASEFPRHWKGHPGVNPGGGGHGGGGQASKRGTAWFFFPNSDTDGRGLDGYWTQTANSAAAAAAAGGEGASDKASAHHPPAPLPPVFYINSTHDGGGPGGSFQVRKRPLCPLSIYK